MPKVKSSTKAPKENSPKIEKASKQADGEKPKRPPSLYQQFMKRELKHYKERHPDISHKDAFTGVAKLWADSSENPNKGQPPKPKKTKKADVKDSSEAD